MHKRLIFLLTLLAFMVLALIACTVILPPGPGTPFVYPSPYVYPSLTPLPPDQQSAYLAAQATLVSGQIEADWLAQQATVISLNMHQAATLSAQATYDFFSSQLLALSVRGTAVSQDMAWAVATQQFMLGQTQSAFNSTASSQDLAATATYSAFNLNTTQTAQSQVQLNLQSTQILQAQGSQTAQSLTATPQAALQEAFIREQNEAARQSIWNEFVYTPLLVLLITLVIILLIVGGVYAYARLLPALEMRVRTIITRRNETPLLLTDSMIVDPTPIDRPVLPAELRQPALVPDLDEELPPVEVIGPFEPSVINWITEAEGQLRSEGWIKG